MDSNERAEGAVTRLRLLLLSAVGFLLPVAIALVLAPIVFEKSYKETEDYSRARLEEQESVSEQSHALLPGSIDPDSSFVVVPTATELDPQNGKTFVISFLLRFNRFPPEGVRSKIIFKYAAAVSPYPGWAIAWRNVSTSLRPEVYWQDATGSGGWFSFDDVPLKLSTWYTVTLFAEPEQFLSLYVGEYLETPVMMTAASVEKRAENSSSPRLQMSYAGGYSMQGLGLAITDDSLHIRAGDSAESDISVDVSEVILGYGERMPKSVGRTKSLLAAGSESVVNYLGTEGLSLWLDADGKDRSRFSRSLISSS